MDADDLILEDFLNKYPLSVAQTLEGLAPKEAAQFLQEQTVERSQSLLLLMHTEKAAKCLAMFPQEIAKTFIESSNLQFAESLLRQLDGPFREDLLAQLSPEHSSELRQKLKQAPNTVGVFMVPAIVVNKEMTVSEAIEILKKNRENLESFLYVVDLDGKLEGAIKLNELLLADGDISLEDLMITKIPRFNPDTPIQQILEHPAWYEYPSIPVVGRFEKLLGTLPYGTTKVVNRKIEKGSGTALLETANALGELYLIGLTGLLQSVGKK